MNQNQSSVTGAGTSPRDLLEQLKAVAPSVAFSVSRELDQEFQWDGDGPDPELEGFRAYDVTVAAKAIVNGAEIEGCEYLGGSYFQEDEPCGDVHGYLPQMLSEAAEELETQLGGRGLLSAELATQLHNAVATIQAESRQRYDEQMAMGAQSMSTDTNHPTLREARAALAAAQPKPDHEPA